MPSITEILSDPADLVRQLGTQIRNLETGGRPDRGVCSSGSHAMDRLLPHSGYVRGSLLELVTDRGNPQGTATLALQIAKQVCQDGKYLVLVAPTLQYFPPALAQLGIPLERVIALRPRSYADLTWGMDQSLRNSAVGCVLGSLERLDNRTAKRLQLGVEAGGGIGILLRSLESTRSHPSWAEVQWLVASSSMPATSTTPRWFDLVLRRCVGGKSGKQLRLGIDATGNWVDRDPHEGQHEKAGHVHLAAQLASSTRIRRDLAG